MFVARAVAKGYKWFAYQWNDGTWGDQQRANWPAYKAAAQGRIKDTIWLTRPFDAAAARQAAVESGCQGIILEAEIPAHRPEAPNWSEVTFYLQDLPIPKAVAATTSPFKHENGLPWPEKARPLVDAGWAFLSQCFITESPNSTPDAMNFYATAHLGWASTQPMVEGWRLPDYGDLSSYANVSHWDAGNVL